VSGLLSGMLTPSVSLHRRCLFVFHRRGIHKQLCARAALVCAQLCYGLLLCAVSAYINYELIIITSGMIIALQCGSQCTAPICFVCRRQVLATATKSALQVTRRMKRSVQSVALSLVDTVSTNRFASIRLFGCLAGSRGYKLILV